jgi:sugar-specific transcriptional regulator TrmB
MKDFKEKDKGVVPALIWGIKGYSNVLAKIQEMVRKSKSEILLNVPDVSIFGEEMYLELEKASERGVKIKMTVEKKGNIEKFRKISMLRTRDKIHGTDIVMDEKEVLVAPSFPIAAAWIDNPEMAVHVKDFLSLVWKDSVVMK